MQAGQAALAAELDAMADRDAARARHVLLLAPYAPSGGGMGRMMAYLAEHPAADGTRFSMIETRGARGAIFAVFPCLRAAWHIAACARGGGETILHVNMAEGSSVFRKGAMLWWGSVLGLPTVLHLHAADIIGWYRRMPAPIRAWTRAAFRRADVCVTLGRLWQDWLQDELGVEAARIEILPNGVPRPTVIPFRAPPPRCTLVFLGNLLPRKGLSDLIAALASDALRGREWELIVAGGGDAAPFRRQAEAAGLSARIRFAGWLGRADATALLARATMLILPSYHEGLPLVLLEAASLGVPAIASLSGAIPDVFTHGDTALLVPAGDIRALSASIQRLIDNPPLRAAMGSRARALYEQSLSIDIFRCRLLGIYARHCAPGRAAVTS
jgi:glycosyltransferase involved in cell wall biosynthesis